MLTQEQKEARKEYIGGSDVAIILGLSNYKTPYQLYLEKKLLIENTQEETPQQYWGSTLENVLRNEFEKRNNVEVQTLDQSIEHPLFPFLKGNLDGFIPKMNAVWEGKTAGHFMAKKWGEENSDVIPIEYLVQVSFYCSVVNCNSAYISVLIGGNDYREFKYMRDFELENKIINATCKFWDRLQNDNPPSAVKTVDLKLMFPNHDPSKTKTINHKTNEELKSLIAIKQKIKELEELEEKEKFNIMNYMQSAECLVDEKEEVVCTLKTNKKGSRTFLIK